MNCKKSLALILVMSMLLSASLSGCDSGGTTPTPSPTAAGGTPAPAVTGTDISDYSKVDTSGWVKDLTLTAGPMGGPWYPQFVTYAELIMKCFPDLSATVIEGAGLGNLRLVNGGTDAQIGMGHLPVYAKAKAGEVEGMEDEDFSKVWSGIVVNTSYVTPVCRADAPYTSFADVANVRFSPGLVTSGQIPVVLDILAEYGLDYDKIRANGGKVDFVNYSEMSSLFQDNHLDIGVLSGDLPNSAVMEMEASFPVRVLPIGDQVLASLKDKYPYILTSLLTPEEIGYKGQTKSVEILQLIGCTLYNTEVLPDDQIYWLTRILLENHEELQANNPNLFFLSWEDAMTGVTEDMMAPGAYRAFMDGPGPQI